MKYAVMLITFLVLITGCTSPGETPMERTHVRMETTAGVMEFELFDELVPTTTENFKKLITDGFYDGTRFHRVIAGFMIQGGDPLTKDVANQAMWGTGGPGHAIDDEFVQELRHDKKGLLSMANSGPNTGGSQFFITLVPTPHLDDHHAIFGVITSGEDVLEAIGSTQTEASDRPVEEIVVTKVTLL